ncbi:hypothetical protein PUNSTDRAFT_139828 [Punctularia strigosozonata HHB-11173 SS5]|uniref:uncharacterized protein n=1 Tax=Punctularia strigosozonata (strain HHB-11173) TaxID=741275 RepID=UPI00044164F5|nr:uncharacterized protein PUNSTDRAFT_139828 [Punctularia strigosozonata HHB-11173 SS5]EIN13188.1 hypothetical protein PUNSTDRAFT_139828 [Punctularia strigosozonata HHB-11173 SS5]
MVISLSDATCADSGYDLVELKKRVEEVEREWWSMDPVAEGLPRVTWMFEDVNAQHAEGGAGPWAPEAVEGSPQETFDHIFRRFRVQANKKYRHPFKPALNFDIIRDPGVQAGVNDEKGEGASEPLRIAFGDASNYTGQQVLDLFGGSTTLTYVRHDDQDDADHKMGPLSFRPWDRKLPPWCTTPPHWIPPAVPPGYGHDALTDVSDESQYVWRAVPTLTLPGLGRNLLPSATSPSLIVSHVFVVASATGKCPTLRVELGSDHVAEKDKRAPTALTMRAIRTHLLGRWIHASTSALATKASNGDNDELAERPAKRARPEPSLDRIGIAWGYEPSTRRLYCVTLTNEEFVVDLSIKASETSSKSVANADCQNEGRAVMRCEWIGPVSLSVDRRAIATRNEFNGSCLNEESEEAYNSWLDTFYGRIRAFRASNDPFVIELHDTDCFVAGCLMLGPPYHGFHCTVEAAKAGSWLVTDVNEYSTSRYEEEGRDENGHVPRALLTHSGSTESELQDIAWEEVASFSVFGVWFLHSLNELQRIAFESRDLEQALETIAHGAFEWGERLPDGIVVHEDLDDETRYKILGKKVAGVWVQLKVICTGELAHSNVVSQDSDEEGTQM